VIDVSCIDPAELLRRLYNAIDMGARIGRSSAERLESARDAFVRACPRLNGLRFVDGMVIPCRVKVCKGKRT